MVADLFLAALPPYIRRQVRSVRLFGPQARRFDPDSPFDLLVVAEARTVEVKTGVAIAESAVEGEGLYAARTTLVTAFDLASPTGQLGRLLQNSQREGIDLWVRDDAMSASPSA